MFFAPCFSLLSAIGRHPFGVSLTTLRNFYQSRIPFACFRPILRVEKSEQKSAKPRESCQASQKEHLLKSSHNSREMNTYIKVARGATAANVIPWNELRSVKEVIGSFAASKKSGRWEAYHEARANRLRRYNSFAFKLLCDPHEELPWNQTLTKKEGGWGALDLGSDPFAITRDRAMINVP